ncbi:hypothetical protein [Arthrobacter sp. NPDC093139]|uniref:hypothetical protein n=1 Tax=Arthrobacter sp. NPDC093139 TaxID=3363945 RepID=UPI00382804B9
MHVAASDERDSQWERRRSTFRVYFFTEPGPGYSVSTFDVADATFTEAKTWADDAAGDRRYSIALVSSDEHRQRGVVWLLGHDLNDIS